VTEFNPHDESYWPEDEEQLLDYTTEGEPFCFSTHIRMILALAKEKEADTCTLTMDTSLWENLCQKLDKAQELYGLILHWGMGLEK